MAAVAQAATSPVTVTWDPVDDSRAIGYELFYGDTPGIRQTNYVAEIAIDGPETSTVDIDLPIGEWFLAVRTAGLACPDNCQLAIVSEFSNEVSVEIVSDNPTLALQPENFWIVKTWTESPMAITVGATTSTSCFAEAGNDQDIAHTTDSGTDVVLALFDGHFGGDLHVDDINGYEWIKTGESAQAATGQQAQNDWADQQLSAATRAAPDIGAGNYRIDLPVTVTEGVQVVVANLIGVDTAVGVDGVRNTSAASQDSGSSINVDVTTVSGDMVVAILYSESSNVTKDAGSTIISEDQSCNSVYTTTAYKTATSTTTNIEFTGASGYTALFALAFAPSATPVGASFIPPQMRKSFAHLVVR